MPQLDYIFTMSYFTFQAAFIIENALFILETVLLVVEDTLKVRITVVIHSKLCSCDWSTIPAQFVISQAFICTSSASNNTWVYLLIWFVKKIGIPVFLRQTFLRLFCCYRFLHCCYRFLRYCLGLTALKLINHSRNTFPCTLLV